MPFTAEEARAIATGIAEGHAWREHRDLYPDLESIDEFIALIERTLLRPTAMTRLDRGRSAYWDDVSGTAVILDPDSADGGTAFRPDEGRAFYERL